MNEDSFVHQDLPHPNGLTPGLEALVLFHQPIGELLTGATLSEREMYRHINFSLKKTTLDARRKNDDIGAGNKLPVCFQVVLPVPDQTRVPVAHDAVHGPRRLHDAIGQELDVNTKKTLIHSYLLIIETHVSMLLSSA